MRSQKAMTIWIWGTGVRSKFSVSFWNKTRALLNQIRPPENRQWNNIHSLMFFEVKNSNGIVFIISIFYQIEPILHQYDFSLGRDYVSPTDILSGGHQINNMPEYS